jgi:hypothetical protein
MRIPFQYNQDSNIGGNFRGRSARTKHGTPPDEVRQPRAARLGYAAWVANHFPSKPWRLHSHLERLSSTRLVRAAGARLVKSSPASAQLRSHPSASYDEVMWDVTDARLCETICTPVKTAIIDCITELDIRFVYWILPTNDVA